MSVVCKDERSDPLVNAITLKTKQRPWGRLSALIAIFFHKPLGGGVGGWEAGRADWLMFYPTPPWGIGGGGGGGEVEHALIGRCFSPGLVCEPSYFRDLNSVAALESYVLHFALL